MPSNHLILCHPLLFLPSIFPSIRVFSNEAVLPIRWPKYWSFSFSISPSNEYSGLISFRVDWLDLFTVQGALKSLLQCHSSKASILQHPAFFIVQLSHPYVTAGKTIALTRRTLVGKVISLLLNMLSRLVITLCAANGKLLQLCPALCDPVDCSLPGSSVHGVFRARILQWVAISFSSGLSHPGIIPGSLTVWTDIWKSEPWGKLSYGPRLAQESNRKKEKKGYWNVKKVSYLCYFGKKFSSLLSLPLPRVT